MTRWRYGWLFPLVLAICLGGLSAWLGRISQVDVEETALNPNEPQYSMTGINGKRFDEQGRLKENLGAETAWQLPKSDDVTFEKPELAMYNGGQLLYTVKSNEAPSGHFTYSCKAASSVPCACIIRSHNSRTAPLPALFCVT